MTLLKLISEIKGGSIAAQQCFFNLMADRSFILCRRFVKNAEDAEERMLDGFYKFFLNIGSFTYQGDTAVYTHLKRIMINECLMQLRKKNSFLIVTESAAADIVYEEDALDNLSAAEIFNLIVQLPVGYRTVFNLSVVEGVEHQEIAALLGISVGASKSQLWKAKSLLQKMLLSKNSDYGKQYSK